MNQISIGIDIGSTATKAILLINGTVAEHEIIPSGWDPKQAGKEVFDSVLKKGQLEAEQVQIVVATGYGRITLPFADQRVTEVTCHGRGAHHMAQGTQLVVDIGGQDSKVIALDGCGRVTDFIMNDKCAAGTGRFLQVMAGVLDLSLDELGKLALESSPATISSMCTVFAESEVIGLLAQGASKGAIAAGVIDSIAKRIPTLVSRMPTTQSITFTGGLANNPAICHRLEQSLKLPLCVPELPQHAGAIGAALIGNDKLTKNK